MILIMMDLEITKRLQISQILVLQYGVIQLKTDTVALIQMATDSQMKTLGGLYLMAQTLSLMMAHNGLILMEMALVIIIFKGLIMN